MLCRCTPRNDAEGNNIAFKGLDAVRQYASKFFKTAESGVDKVVSSCEKNPNVHWRYMNFLRQRKTALDAQLYAVSAGRSMIEMLGVLAIAGVLSVGGIAGYSKAMMKWKIDKAIEEYNFLIQGLIEHKDSIAKSYSSGDVALLSDFIVSTNLVPQTWHYTGYFINDSVGNYLKPYLNVASKTIVIDVYFPRTDNPKANEYSYRLCEAMFKDFAYPLASVLNVIFVYNNTYNGTHYWGNSRCQTDDAEYNTCLQDITLPEINQECRKCIEGNNGTCGIVFTL